MADDPNLAQKYYDSLEKLVIGTLERAVAEKRLLGFPMRLFELNLALRHQAERVGAAVLGRLGLPTPADFREVQERLHRAESRLHAQRTAAAEAEVEAEAEAAPAPAPKPKRKS